MDSSRRCTRSSCGQPAVATLTYSYRDSTVVVGPMSVYPEPHTYDLCARHADSVTPPRGWEVLRLDYPSAPADAGAAAADDLLAVVDAVQREDDPTPATDSAGHEPGSPVPGTLPSRESRGRIAPPEPTASVVRGHLRLLDD
nr:DUF3499 family protein [Nesterenkonia sp. F]